MIGVTPKKPSAPVRAADSGKRVESTHLRLQLQLEPPVAAPGEAVVHSRLDGELFGFLSTNCRRLPTEFWYLDFVT